MEYQTTFVSDSVFKLPLRFRWASKDVLFLRACIQRVVRVMWESDFLTAALRFSGGPVRSNNILAIVKSQDGVARRTFSFDVPEGSPSGSMELGLHCDLSNFTIKSRFVAFATSDGRVVVNVKECGSSMNLQLDIVNQDLKGKEVLDVNWTYAEVGKEVIFNVRVSSWYYQYDFCGCDVGIDFNQYFYEESMNPEGNVIIRKYADDLSTIPRCTTVPKCNGFSELYVLTRRVWFDSMDESFPLYLESMSNIRELRNDAQGDGFPKFYTEFQSFVIKVCHRLDRALSELGLKQKAALLYAYLLGFGVKDFWSSNTWDRVTVALGVPFQGSLVYSMKPIEVNGWIDQDLRSVDEVFSKFSKGMELSRNDTSIAHHEVGSHPPVHLEIETDEPDLTCSSESENSGEEEYDAHDHH